MAVGLGIQVVLLAIIGSYVWKFRRTSRLFESFQRQWTEAASAHKTLLSEARERVSTIAAPPPDTLAFHPRRPSLSTEARSHVVAMSRKGLQPAEIARTCGMPESAVQVVLGFARLQETRNA
jgi:hypothetical protein